MNILGISGTPRENGNSEILLQHALRPFEKQGWQVKNLRVREMSIEHCRGCDSCRETGTCAIDDDMQQVYDAFRWCDAIIVSSPVYSRNVAARLMALLERHYAVNQERPLEGKPGGAIAVGAGTCGGQTITIMAIYNWMLSRGIICVPGELNGVTAVASDPGDILKQPKRLRQAEILGENVLNVAKKLRGT
jgi:multimeric flavodoxin WrbA